jgi:diguanylate cyclase (GGDEF)-like protein
MAAGKDPLGGSRAEVVRVGEVGPANWLALDSFNAYANDTGSAMLTRIASNAALARAFGDHETAWRCRDIMVSALAAAGRLEQSVALADELMAHYRETGQSASRLQILGQVITSRLGLGDFEQALDGLTDALVGLAHLRDSSRASASAFLTVGNAASATEMFEVAASHLRRATQMARQVDIPFLTRMVDGTIARNELRYGARLEMLGRRDDAAARYREALRAAVRAQAGEPIDHWRRIGRLYEGYAWTALDEPVLGRIALLESLGPDEAAMPPEDTLILRLGLARGCAALGLADEARGHLRRTSGVHDTTFSHQWQVAIVLEAANIERVEHGDHPGIALAEHAAVLLANSLWEERERRLEAVMVRMQMLELSDENERVGQAATEDPLTGLGNRRKLDVALAAMGEDGPACLLFIDLDRFKNVNDQFSHAIGDEVLKTVADLLRRESRDSDVLIRYGGDEFVVVLSATDLDVAARVGERIRVAVATHPWWRIAPGLDARVSVGVAEQRQEMNFDEVMGAADAALYRAKQGGRDQVAVA